MTTLVASKNNQYIELCEMPEGEVAGRAKIRASALEIHSDNSEYNSNGITWLEEYVKENIESAIGMPYVVSWLEEGRIPSDHGTMSYNEEGYVEFEGVSVGSVQEAYIDNVEIDGENKKVLMTEGYLYKQRYPEFVEWLKEEIESGTIFGSIEINGKGSNKQIEYLNGATDADGNKLMGRVPTVFDFTGLAILYLSEPSDRNSIVFEVNNKEDAIKGDSNMTNKKKVAKGKSVEINKLSYEDILALTVRAFHKSMGIDEYCFDYYPYRFYPIDSQIVFARWDKPGEYYMVNYSIENTTVTLSDIVRVEEDWQPASDSEPVEVNTDKIKELINNEKGGTKTMSEEKNNENKVAELSSQVTELNQKVTELNTETEEKDKKINELNEALTEANKKLEEVNEKYKELEEEYNQCKEEKNSLEEEKKKAEVNTYFEEQIPKNKFEEEEINTLKEYVEKCDLEGLKKAEAELIVKRFKEGKLDNDVETNDKKEDNFIKTKEETVDKVEEAKELF